MFNCLLAGVGVSLQGWEHGVAGGAIHNLKEFGGVAGAANMGPMTEGWIISSLWATTLVGNVAYMFTSTPKQALVISAFLQTVGSAVTGFAPTMPVLICGRLINGLGMGLTSVAIGQYTSEVAPPEVRAGAVACQETNFVGGALLGALLSSRFVQKPRGWRRLWGAGSIVSLTGLACLARLPETPRTMFKTAAEASSANEGNSPEEQAVRTQVMLEAVRARALQSLCQVRGLAAPDDALHEEVRAMERSYIIGLPVGQQSTNLEADSPAQGLSWTTTVSRFDGSRKARVLAGLAACAMPALTGHESLMNYSLQWFKMVGQEGPDGLVGGGTSAASLAVYLYGAKFLTTLPDFLWLDKFGRRFLLMFGLVGVTACYQAALAGMAMHWRHAPAAALMASAVVYQAAVGPMTWVLSTEVWPSDMRSSGSVMGQCTYSLLTWISLQMHPWLARKGGVPCVAVYAVSCAGAVALGALAIPDLHGRALEEVDVDFLVPVPQEASTCPVENGTQRST